MKLTLENHRYRERFGSVDYQRSQAWRSVCSSLCVKANKMLALIKRTLGNKDRTVFLALYKSILVRPHLEYCCAVNGHLAIRRIKNYWKKSNTDSHNY